MMLGRFVSYAWVRLEDGRIYWGWFEETRIATSWFLGYSEKRPDQSEYIERDLYFNTGEVREIEPCDEELCEGLTEKFGFAPVDWDAFRAALPRVQERLLGGKV